MLAACEPARPPDPFTATGRLVALSGGDAGAANACFTCHGLDGRGDADGAPRLAAIDAGYLARQLDDYARGRRAHDQMAAIARRLSAGDRQAVADHYAALPFVPRAAAPAAPSSLYTEGDPARGLLPCAACHGRDGEGVGPGNPPLGGQPAAYLADQLRQWRASQRRSDPGNLMLAISRQLTPAEVESVAAHAAALPGVPRREPRAASPAARRDGPRNDASALPRRAAGPE
jgi:cytochrome c553